MMLSSEMSSSINALIHAVDILSFKVVSPNHWYSHICYRMITHLKLCGEERFIDKA